MIPRARIDGIDEAVIRRLIDDEVRESRTLDFKEALDLTREGKQGLADDVCAFANTVGGDLVFGLTAPGGVAGEIRPVFAADLDAELLRLTNYLRDACEPRVTTALLSRAVPLAGGGHVVVLRVSPSPNAPHRVNHSSKFFLRNSVGKEPMDIHAIRTAFAFSEGLAERVTAFRDRRLARFGRTPGAGIAQNRDGRFVSQVALVPGPLIAFHVMPVFAFTRRDMHTVEQLQAAARRFIDAQPGGYRLQMDHINFEGVVRTSAPDEERRHFAFAQVFRDGCIEMVGALTTEDRGNPPLPTFGPAQHERALVHHDLPAALAVLADLDIPAPVYLSVSLLNVGGTRMVVTRDTGQAGYPALPSHLFRIVSPPLYVEDLGIDPLEMVRPALDMEWNAVDVAHTQTNFDRGAR